ncbi:hypothetical protein HYN59_08730 [Flavobacterium album]|uniref:Uncharacterized protein n=1 Tax=Flavobacterium album TaxID=2175091 RepID=A0A2S1QY77_9FLAO|nr:T9SS type A sorting domain-containing protein [Flavobacterium album]AWH85201.1 hypothetical protein HYN59_08730 [Flavobacterium album]
MKSTLLFLMLLLSGIAGAQIVNIPDVAFKNALLTGDDIIAKNSTGNSIVINANGDGEVQMSEALAVWEMTITNNYDGVSIQGIEAFSNLRTLTLDYLYNVIVLNLTGLSNLEHLSIAYFGGDEINIDGLSNLKSLFIENAFYADISNVGLSSLTDLQVNYSAMNIDMTQLPAIERVQMAESDQRICNFSGCTNLQLLKMEHAYGLQSITLGDKPFLAELLLDNDGNDANLTSIDISGCTALTRLNIYYDNPIIQQGVRYLNLKNGVTEYESFSVVINTLEMFPVYVCVEEGMEGLITTTAQSGQYTQISTYCSFTPGGDYNTIAGNLTFDNNNNGCDGNDAYTGFVRLNIDNGLEQLSTFTASGHYNFFTQAGTYTLTPQLENDWFTVTPPMAAITQEVVDNSTTTQNFCVTADGVHPDVEVVITPLWNAQPGFDAYYKIIYRNKGNQTLSGAITLNYYDNVLDYVGAYPAETSSATGTLSWNYSDLLPFESRTVFVTFNLNGPMETPAVNIDDVLAFSASVTSATSDENPADNTFVLNQIVTGSFDPNDITCLEGHSVFPDRIGDYLHYNINFENTGTAPATFIVVKDNIDETKFDISSLQLMDASHAIHTRIKGNKVEFIFDNINLGPEEKGNVTFKIKTKSTLQVNDDVTQQADIFFDYNWPIQTNEATTTFEVLSRGDFAKDNSVKVYPNPVKDIVTISANSNIKSIQLYDIQGRLLQSATANDVHTTIDLSSRASGIYFVKVLTDKGIKVEKAVKE